MEGRVSFPSHIPIVAQTVASVGPYALRNRRSSVVHRLTISFETASPAEITVFRNGSSEAGSTASTEGGSVTVVIACFLKSNNKGSTGIRKSGAAITSVAPAHRAIAISEMDASKLIEANCR